MEGNFYLHLAAVVIGGYITYKALVYKLGKPTNTAMPNIPHFFGDDNLWMQLELDGANRLTNMQIAPVTNGVQQALVGNGLYETGETVLVFNQMNAENAYSYSTIAPSNYFYGNPANPPITSSYSTPPAAAGTPSQTQYH